MNIIPAPKDTDVQLSLSYDEEMHCIHPKKYARLLINGIPVLLLKDGHFTVCAITEKQSNDLEKCGIEISKFSTGPLFDNPEREDKYYVLIYDPFVTQPKKGN